MVNNKLNKAELVPTAGQNFFLVFSTFAVVSKMLVHTTMYVGYTRMVGRVIAK